MYNSLAHTLLPLVKTSDISIKKSSACLPDPTKAFNAPVTLKPPKTPESISKAQESQQGCSETPDERGKAESAKCLIEEKETLRDRTG